MVRKISARNADNQRSNSGHKNVEAHKWPRGRSGNPAGRPKGEVPSETLAKMLGAEFGPDAVKQLQKTMPEPWRSKPALTVQEITMWVILRRAMQSAGDQARKEVFDRIEGRPTLKIAGPTGGPIEHVVYDLSKLSSDKIRLIRELLSEALIADSERE